MTLSTSAYEQTRAICFLNSQPPTRVDSIGLDCLSLDEFSKTCCSMASSLHSTLAKQSWSALLLLLCTELTSFGAIWFELPQVTVTGNGLAPTSGFLDVVVRADAADLPKSVTAFNVDFAFTTATSIQFKTPQAAPNPLIAGTPLNFSPNAQRALAALDLASGATSLANGMGLVRVPFDVPAGVTGVFPLAFGPANQLADMDANAIGLATTDTGSITINSSPAIAGDYNANGSVGPEDYLLWRSSFARATRQPPMAAAITASMPLITCSGGKTWGLAVRLASASQQALPSRTSRNRRPSLCS